MGLVLKNGVVVGWANLNTVIGGIPLTGIRSIDLTVEQKKENVYGAGSQPIGRGRGRVEYPESSMEILLEEWKAIVAAAPNNDPNQIPMFNIPLVYDNGMPGELVNNCEFTSVARTYKEGDTAMWLKVGFIFAGLNQNN